LRIRLDENGTFSDLLKFVFDEITSASENLNIGISLLDCTEDFLKGPRLYWFNSSPDLNVCIMPPPSEQSEMGLVFEPFSVDSLNNFYEPSPQDVPMSFLFWDTDEGIRGSGAYQADLIAPDKMSKFVDYLSEIAGRVTQDRSVRVAAIRNRWTQGP